MSHKRRHSVIATRDTHLSDLEARYGPVVDACLAEGGTGRYVLFAGGHTYYDFYWVNDWADAWSKLTTHSFDRLCRNVGGQRPYDPHA